VESTWGKLAALISDLGERARGGDWRQTGGWLVGTLVSLPYRGIEYTVFARSLLGPLPRAKPRQPVTLRLAEETDLDRFRGLVLPSEWHHFRRRLAHGRHCFLALDSDRLAAYCWATSQVEFAVDNIEVPLQPGDAYVDDAFTVPAYRRQGIQTAVHLYRLTYLKDLGCQRAILIVENDNVASQRLVRKLGYREVARLSFRRVLWRRTYDYQPRRF